MMIAVVRPTCPGTFLAVFPVGRFCGGVTGAGLRWVCRMKATWARITLVRSVPASMTPHDGMVVDGPGPDPVLRSG